MSHLSDLRFLPPCALDLRPSVTLRSVDWYLPTFREYLSVTYFKGQAAEKELFLNCLTLEEGTL